MSKHVFYSCTSQQGGKTSTVSDLGDGGHPIQISPMEWWSKHTFKKSTPIYLRALGILFTSDE